MNFILIFASIVHLVDRVLGVAVYCRERCAVSRSGSQLHACIETRFRQSRVSHKGTVLV